TSARRSTVADEAGSWNLVNLEPGVYLLTIESPGFHSATYKGIEVLARQTVRVDGALSLASQTETVNVTAGVESVITTDVSSIAETKTNKELLDLPVAIGSRAAGSTSPISTLTTQAGVQTDASGGISVAGAKPAMLSVSVDGISSMSPRNSAPIAELFPSFNTIAEIRVSEVNNAAEYGGVSDITTISRGGSNSFHGGVFENLQNTVLNARNPFSATRPKLNMNNFGGFVGGPLSIPGLYRGRDRTFFFFSYESLRLPREELINRSVPSAALRAGNLSGYATRPVLDPDTGIPFPGNQIPASRISPISSRVLDLLFQMPNSGSPTAVANNYRQNFSTPISSDQGDVRLDQNISSSQTAFARFSYKKRDTTDAPAQTVLAGATKRPEYYYGLTVAHNYVLSARLVNEIRGGVNGTRSYTSSGLNARETLAALGLSSIPDPPNGSGGPVFNIAGFQTTAVQSAAFSKAETIQLLDNITYTQGRHTIKTGIDFRRMTGYFTNVFAAVRASQYTFNGSVTNSIIGNPFAAFLLGVPDTTRLGTVTNPDTHSKAIHWASFVQDDWKVTSRLTVNYGIRWEYHPAFGDRLNNIANFLPDYRSVVNGVAVNGAVVVPDKGYSLINPDFSTAIAPTPFITASAAGLPQTLHRPQRTTFAPRVGVAWRPFADGKTVIRGGFGKYIETLLANLITAGWAVGASYTGLYTQQLVDGKPVLNFPYPFPANRAQPGTATFDYAGAVDYKDPYVYQWNFTFERDLGFQTGLRLSYDGSHGVNLGIQTNANQVPANTSGWAVAQRAAPYPQFSAIRLDVNGARSNYNAFTVALNKRFSNGLQFNNSYIFARNLSNGGGYNPTGFAGEAGGMVTDRFNVNLDYGNVAFTRRHRFLSTFLYDLPVGKNRMFLGNAHSILNGVIGGWQLSGVIVAQSGPFLTVVAPGADPAGNNFVNQQGAGRADIVPGAQLYPENQTAGQWINPGAFAIPRNNIGRPGNSSVGSILGPGTQAVSLSIFKTFTIMERVRFQIGAAAANALNHQNLATPNLSLGTAPFGTITNVQQQEGAGARSVQLTARITF
ncbi:MAG: TonB-dependent receptor, partial [Bryobacteraceae bacterium]|nr:TonB-dependent receptor [Bryobacteraceae bacterium]